MYIFTLVLNLHHNSMDKISGGVSWEAPVKQLPGGNLSSFWERMTNWKITQRLQILHLPIIVPENRKEFLGECQTWRLKHKGLFLRVLISASIIAVLSVTDLNNCDLCGCPAGTLLAMRLRSLRGTTCVVATGQSSLWDTWGALERFN